MQKEIGRIGQRRFGGIVYEEFLPELRGSRGVEIYHEMSENDDVVGAILYAIEMLVRQTKWNVEPGGSTAKDKEAAEFVESCMDDMQNTWVDTISEILSFLTYGWSYHEIVYKRRMGNTADTRTRSKYSDGLIGWAKLPIIAQETLYQWEYDENDNLTGMTQMPPPDYGLLTIPLSKALLFRTKSRKDNPEGRSILRNAYRSWHFKRRIQEIEGIGIERDLAGLPVMYAPEGMDIWNDNDDDIKRTLVTIWTVDGYEIDSDDDEGEDGSKPKEIQIRTDSTAQPAGSNIEVKVDLAPTIKIEGSNMDENKIFEIIKSRCRELADDIGGELADKLAQTYSNMPLTGET